MRGGRVALLLLAALALGGCESSQEESARLEKVAKVREAAEARRTATKRRLLKISRPSHSIHVSGVTLLRSAEGLATVVTLQNRSPHALREVPIRINVRDAHGSSLFTNETPGQAAPLISASLIPAHGRFTWIDDQIPAIAGAARATAEVGEAPSASRPIPALEISGAHQIEDPSSGKGAEGEIVNRSATRQSELVVYAIVRRGSAVTAAGRAVVPEVPAGARTRFQLFFVGNPSGGRLEVTAPPSTLG